MPEDFLFIESQNLGAVEDAKDGTYPVTRPHPALVPPPYTAGSVVPTHPPKASPAATPVHLAPQGGGAGEPAPDGELGPLGQDTTIRGADVPGKKGFKDRKST